MLTIWSKNKLIYHVYLFTHTGIQHDYHIIIMLFRTLNSDTTRVTCETGTANPSRAPEITPVFTGVRVARSLVFYIKFIDTCLSFFPFSFGDCIFWPSSINGVWLPLCYLQPFFRRVKIIKWKAIPSMSRLQNL